MVKSTSAMGASAYGRSVRISTELIDQVVVFLIVMCPILQHYQGFALEASSEVLILLAPYVLLKLFMKRKLVYKTALPLLFYAVYISFIHGFHITIFFREMLLLLYYFSLLNGCIDARRYFRCAKVIAICVSCCILAQYVFYYVFHRHLQFVPTGLFTESAEQWTGLAQTGLISVSGKRLSFYRPSGFLLEPSHVSVFCIPVLCILLLQKDISRRAFAESVVVSLGVALSTSGMGIFFVGGVWLLYLWQYYGIHEGQRRKPGKWNRKVLLYLMAILVLAVVLYGTVGFFRSAVNRVFVSDEGDKTAIGGRTSTGMRLLQRLSGPEILIGEGTSYDITQWNVSGFFYVTFQFGLIGCLLLNLFYIKSLFRVKNGYFWLAVLAMALSPFTVHTFAAFYRMYYVCCIMGGYLPGAAAGDPGKRRDGAAEQSPPVPGRA